MKTGELNRSAQWRVPVREHFIGYCRKRGADVESQKDAFAIAGEWLADCVAAWCPSYLERRLGIDPPKDFDGPDRGLLLYGEVGRGKTYLARKIYECYSQAAKMSSANRKAVFVYDSEFYIGSLTKGPDYLEEFFFGNQRKILFFDDLGNGEEAKRYGNAVSGREILRFRHMCREKYGVPAVITTNLNSKTLAEKYDIYVESRVYSDYRSIFLQYPRDRRKERWA